MAMKNTRQVRQQRREAGEQRQAEREQRSPKQQLKELDLRLGKGKGAQRERARLQEALAAEPAPPKRIKKEKSSAA